MDRLTIRVDDGLDDIYFAVASDPEGIYNICDLAQYRTENGNLLTGIAERLAAYEDTGLTPEEILSVMELAEKLNVLDLVHENLRVSRLIRHSDADNTQLRKELEQQRIDKNHLHEIIAEQGKKIGEYELNPAYKQAKAERDAAIKDLQIIADAGSCDVCAYDGQSCEDAVHKADVNGGSCFKWRGLEGRA